MSPDIGITVNLLPYADRLELRGPDSIDLIVIHCTELPDLESARRYGERIHHAESRTGNCGHFYIERSGKIEQWVPTERVAHHVRGYNQRSIGIELDNIGRYPDWWHSRKQQMSQPYSQQQLASLLGLLQSLLDSHPSIEWIAGHEDLDTALVPASDDPGVKVRRKCDPGPQFPWGDVVPACGLKRLRQ